MSRLNELIGAGTSHQVSVTNQKRKTLERFVAKEPLRRVHECVFGVLALESEPVEPRL